MASARSRSPFELPVLDRGDTAGAEEARRATDQRLDREVAQLRAAGSPPRTQLDLRAHDLAEQARERARLSAVLEGGGGRRRR